MITLTAYDCKYIASKLKADDSQFGQEKERKENNRM